MGVVCTACQSVVTTRRSIAHPRPAIVGGFATDGFEGSAITIGCDQHRLIRCAREYQHRPFEMAEPTRYGFAGGHIAATKKNVQRARAPRMATVVHHELNISIG